jgi:hypothetical protein
MEGYQEQKRLQENTSPSLFDELADSDTSE